MFFAVGFETTAPANAMALLHAARAGLAKLQHAGEPCPGTPAITTILDAPDNEVQAFLAVENVIAYGIGEGPRGGGPFGPTPSARQA